MGDGLCQGCRAYPPEFERAVSYGEYDGDLRELVHLLKYEKVLPAAPVLGDMLAVAIFDLLWGREAAPVLLVPVPLHPSKHNSRGFNQAERIAKAAARKLPGHVEVARSLLRRLRNTRSQVGLTRDERLANLRDAFRVREDQRLQGHTVIVVDDVMTTGTTVSECARVLKQAGAERVWAATVARTLRGADVRDIADHGEKEATALSLSV